MARHRTLTVYVSPDAYVFEPVDDGRSDFEKTAKDVLVLDRLTGSVALNPPNRSIPLTHEAVHTVYGILGIVSLALTDHLILISSLRLGSARFLGHDVHSPDSYLILPLSSAASTASSAYEDELLALVRLALDTTPLWFSYTFDLTSSLQRQATGSGPDERFFWNYELTRRLVDAGGGGAGGRNDSVAGLSAELVGDISSFVLPVICGSFDLRSVSLPNAPTLLLLLISRRSRHRPGTRFLRRGIDEHGNVANYVETEQIIVCDPPPPRPSSLEDAEAADGVKSLNGKAGGLDSFSNMLGEGRVKCSFVQVRGSAPVFWGQINNLRYTPDLLVMDLPSTTDALRAHLTSQVERYRKVHLVNLVNQVKYERPVKEAFENALLVLGEDEPKARYWYWDFHRECKGMRFDRIEGLVDKLKGEVESEGWFQWEAPLAMLVKGQRAPAREQTSVVRTNCMDSLDRTNVLQSALARSMLDLQLRSLSLLGPNESIAQYAEFAHAFRSAWADHADAVSTMYSGTGALKTDFTRTGRRTWRGALEDGRRSLVRYWKNNFSDGERQDALDLITGSWKIRRGTPSPFVDDRPYSVQLMPYVLALALCLLTVGICNSYNDLLKLGPRAFIHLPLLALVALVSFLYIWANGTQYVNWPRLTVNNLLSYTGPGPRTTPRGRGSRRLLPRSLPKLLPGAIVRRLPWISSSASAVSTPRTGRSPHIGFDASPSSAAPRTPRLGGHAFEGGLTATAGGLKAASLSGSWAVAGGELTSTSGSGGETILGDTAGARRKGRATGRLD